MLPDSLIYSCDKHLIVVPNIARGLQFPSLVHENIAVMF